MLVSLSEESMRLLRNPFTAHDTSGKSERVKAVHVDEGYVGLPDHCGLDDRALGNYATHIVSGVTTWLVDNSDAPCSPILSAADSGIDGMHTTRDRETEPAAYKPDWTKEFLWDLAKAYQSTHSQLDPDHYLNTPRVLSEKDDNRPEQACHTQVPDPGKESGDFSSLNNRVKMSMKPPTKVNVIELANRCFSYQEISEMTPESFKNILRKESDQTVCQLARVIRGRTRKTMSSRVYRKIRAEKMEALAIDIKELRARKEKLESENEEISRQLEKFNKWFKALRRKSGVKSRGIGGGPSARERKVDFPALFS